VFDAGTVATDTTVTIAPLAEGERAGARCGHGERHQGPRRGYRYLPHGAKFLKSVALAMPTTARSFRRAHRGRRQDFYFDDQAGRWVELPALSVDKSNKLINSTTDHFTDMINATVTVPDHPQTVSVQPTSMRT